MDAIVIGAGSSIGNALATAWEASEEIDRTWRIQRNPARAHGQINHRHVIHTDHTDSAIDDCVNQLTAAGCSPRHVAICLGKLHDQQIFPERRIEEFSVQNAEAVFRVNAFLPVRWLQGLLPILTASPHCSVAVCSARVGSISDNRLGGWYSYRASKAALNMLLKTFAIELSRRAPKVKLIAYHPGTVQSPLSAPFLASVAAEKRFSPEYSAAQLAAILRAVQADGRIEFLDWAGTAIDW